MAEVRVRKAMLEDVDAIAPLFDGYRQFYEQSPDLAGAGQFIRARLHAGDSAIFVAERDGQLIGFTQLYPSFSSASMKRVWILNDLFVAPEQRLGGVGSALMKAAEAFALESGAKGLVLATKKTNLPASALYQTRGWKLDEVFDHYHRFF